jgi:CTP:molybdopterin cytidylyltransferase MocA
VTITGANFVSGATVTFGGTAATNVVVVSGTQMTATTGAHAAGVVTVVVTNPTAESGSLANGYTYVAAPTVTGVSPSTGPTAGGTGVTITGTNFVSGATVTLGGTAATNVVVVSGTQMTATTGAHAAGAVNVVVTNPDGQSGSLASGYTYVVAATISFAQVAAATPQAPTKVVPVAYPGAQTAGDLNIVVVGWADTTSTVSSVVDSLGNTYSLAIGPTSGNGFRQSIYYAKNILAGNNTVTVTFNQAATYPDVRILEYRGVSTLDVTAGAVGISASASSGAAGTTAANELIFGAGTTAGGFSGGGTGFTARIITTPNVDIAEDQTVTSAGSYSAVAPLFSSAAWVMQMATFK